MDIAAPVIGLIAGLILAVVALRRWERSRAVRLLGKWRLDAAGQLADDARRRSRAVVRGQIAEQIAPLHPDFRWEPGDARFLGKPVDFVIFAGLTAVRQGRLSRLQEIVIVDIKTGQAGLSRSERRIKACVDAGRVWCSEPMVGR